MVDLTGKIAVVSGASSGRPFGISFRGLLLIRYRPPSAFSIAVDSYVCLKKRAYADRRPDPSKAVLSPEGKGKNSVFSKNKKASDRKRIKALPFAAVYPPFPLEKMAVEFPYPKPSGG